MAEFVKVGNRIINLDQVLEVTEQDDGGVHLVIAASSIETSPTIARWFNRSRFAFKAVKLTAQESADFRVYIKSIYTDVNGLSGVVEGLVAQEVTS